MTKELAERWRNKAEAIEPFAPAAAEAFRRAADELELETRTHCNACLKVAAAARECGYSAQHLRRMVREGRLHNYGKKNAPLIRRGDLPLRVRG